MGLSKCTPAQIVETLYLYLVFYGAEIAVYRVAEVEKTVQLVKYFIRTELIIYLCKENIA